MDCQAKTLETIWFTFHPKSSYSGICPHQAVLLISKALHFGWTALELAGMLDGDHSTDDDPHKQYNRKTELYSRIYEQERRFQELKHGGIEFLDATGHRLKTIQHGDSSRTRPEWVQLREERKEASIEQACSLSVDDLVEFTSPLQEQPYDFDLKEFLVWVYPYWVKQAEKIKLIILEVEFTSSYITKDIK